MDGNQTDRLPGCHLDLTALDAAVVIVAARERILDELTALTTTARADAHSRPRIPAQARRVPGAHCPIPGCSHHHGPDDPPLFAISP